ncbi:MULTISPECIES: gamma-glutamyl-gamma-aminobutyrate hydrolase family protein [unclassified Shewanella]|uniref:gamma-glutamyl-gamma-aminobutyrate hydrolase family protein n=1 Tax=Shewanella TaxID=22 RepID=UPI0021DB2006|nr:MULTISPECIES: gamma-glutamyl-gamma-aminobutyrate hydrolase family protein [unclassified Shewanella]MCU8020375.1 gamma-glutamyl-gamma-aminobutyrate hydrolase family protein [Shewanella sp. SM78]MCU8045779.1 gamma-glutamyl-gamma-aminobutyrate hydrolase family protein [Shewanella sp. SM68]MCU8050015.1 gamma-glutamyl-gamma-aminobutyrate hydrolase family protein [Shewanella sp. SM65]MCU8077551.1 gamma-glutamyl-gamma-aminobutyrate hydrolase family protein [Shewanella sp. SM103]
MSADLPLIGVIACNQQLGSHSFNIVGEKYLLGVVNGAKGWPLVIPSLGGDLPIDAILDRLDGILFTGSPSNVEPHLYAGQPSELGTHHDPKRDATTLPLIHAAIAAGVPVLGICRGFQEMNVAFGGSLHQKLHEVGGFIEHREDKTASLDVQYGASHSITVEPGGLIYEAWGRDSAEINSVHTQGVERLGVGLRPEAYAPDGLVEAFSVIGTKEFALGVQWHPEWKVSENPFYLSIFNAFGDACRRRATTRVK